MTQSTTTLLNSNDTLLDMSDDGSLISYVETSGQDQSLYVLDVNTGQKQLITTYTSTENQAGGFSSDTGIGGGILSANGQYLLYSTGVINGNVGTSISDVHFYIKDLQDNSPPYDVTPQVPQTSSYLGILFGLSPSAISNDGLTIAFAEDYTDYSGANPSFTGVVVENLVSGFQQKFASLNNSDVQNVRLTPDGRYLSYYDGAFEVQDLQSGTKLQIPTSFYGGTSDTGRYFAYTEFFQANGQPGYGDGVTQVVLHDNDAPAGTPDQIIDTSSIRQTGDTGASFAAFSGDGRHVVFVEEHADSSSDLYVKDLDSGTISLIQKDYANNPTDQVFISYDGSRIFTQNGGAVTLTQYAAPTLTINPVGTNDFINGHEPTITVSGTSDAIGETVHLGIEGTTDTVTAVVQANGTWSTLWFIGTPSPDGVHTLDATVTNELTTTAKLPLIVDTTPPVFTVSSIAGDDIINAAEISHAAIDGTVLIADPTGPGTVAGEIQVEVDQGPVTTFVTQASQTAQAEDFSDALNASGVADGTHTITLTAIDEAGNKTVVTKQVLVDTTPPKIAITSVSQDDVVDSAEVKSPQGVHGTSDAIGDTVDVLIDGAEAGQAVVQADGTWLTTVSFESASTGEHDVTAEVYDEAGNPGRSDAGVYVDRGFSVQQLSDGPDGEQGGGQGVLFPSLSGDGTKLVFTGLNFNLMSTATGSSGAQVYIKDLTTGAISFAAPDPSENAEFGAISPDGQYIEFVSNAGIDPNWPDLYYTYTEDLTTGVPYVHAFDSTDPDTFDPGVMPAYYDLGNYADGTAIAPLPVYPLAIADNGIALKMWESLPADQTSTPLFLDTAIMVDDSYVDGTPNGPDDELTLIGPNLTDDQLVALGFSPTPAPNTNILAQVYAPEISADGSTVAFEGRLFLETIDSSTYPPPFTVGPGSVPEIFAGGLGLDGYGDVDPSIILASSYADGTPMPFGAVDPALSANGQFVAFWSWGTDDVPEVFVKNLATGELKIASSDALGNSGVGNASGTFNAGFNSIAISADGRYVAFTSDAALTPDDTNGSADLFVKDMQTGSIQRVDLPPGTFADDLSTQLAMRADGQYIAFTTTAALSPLDVNGVADVYGLSLASMGSTPPKITINALTGDDRVNASETSKNLQVSGTSDAIGQTVTLYTDDGALPGVTVAADGTWSTTIDTANLPDNTYQLRATVANAAGATASAGDIFTLDTVAPTVELSSDKTHLSAGQTATITASFSEGIGNLSTDFLTAAGGTLSALQFTNDHTLTALFTPDAGATTFSISAKPDAAFDLAGNPGTGATLTVGSAFDGYLAGSTIFADANANGVYDAGEATATTDATGGFVLNDAAGPLILTGGTDISTGLAFSGKLEAPAGATVVTPLTTVAETLTEASGDTAAQAGSAVLVALGLPAGIDLTTFDAVAGAQAGDPSSTAVFKAGSDVLDAVTLIQAAGGSADAAYAALAADVTAAAAAGTAIDLADEGTLVAIAQAAGLDPAAAQAVASIASQTGAALDQQLAGSPSPLEAFIDITGASIAEQGYAASALAQTSGDAAYQAVMTNYLENLGGILNQYDATAAENVACYAAGTLIATELGEVAVEHLKIGDQVAVMSGDARPIKWIGRRRYRGHFIVGRKDILPVCIKADALGLNVPRRDLWISPHHAMYFDGVLIEARDLIDGVSIVQAEHVDSVEYYHIELDSHDVILAEGALSETFLDDDSRGMFHNAHEYDTLYPDAAALPPRYCAPRRDGGYEVEAARQRIDARGGSRPEPKVHPHALRGYVDVVSSKRIAGWAQNTEHPEALVCLDIFAGGRLIGQTLANLYREDLERAGLGSGRHSFDFTPAAGLSFAPNAVEVRRSLDGAVLARSHGATRLQTLSA